MPWFIKQVVQIKDYKQPKQTLTKKGLTIPRLELVSVHTAANLAENVKNALQGQPVKSVYGWLDSKVALHWIKGVGGSTYK